MARARHKGTMQAQFFLCPIGKLLVEILGGVGKGGEDDELAVAGIERRAALALDDFAQSLELGVPRRAYLFRRRKERRQPVAVLGQVLPPADTVNVLQQHLYLAADEQALESWEIGRASCREKE